MNFTKFYEAVEYDLLQADDNSAGMSSNSAKPLPKEHAKRIINEVIISLLGTKASIANSEVIEHTFTFDTDTIQIDNAIEVYAVRRPGTSWKMIQDDYTKYETGFRRISSNTIKATSGFKSGDILEIKCTLTPLEIVNDTDPIDFPDKYMELLRKAVVIEVGSIIDATLNQLYFQRYTELLRIYVEDHTILVGSSWDMQGAGMGRLGS